jgi:hypothetical protein
MTSVVAYWVGYDGPRKPVTPPLPPRHEGGAPNSITQPAPKSPGAPYALARALFRSVCPPPTKAGADALEPHVKSV